MNRQLEMCQRAATLLVLALACGAGVTQAALLPAVSSDLVGQPVGDFQATMLDGQPFSASDLVGKPVLVNFFASWCPVCTTELRDLRALAPELRQRGFVLIGVLVDSVETPDTVGQARQSLTRDPLPFPVLLMTPALRETFRYEGFPATYFITSDGLFSTTLFGYQPSEQVRQVAASLVGAVSESTTGAASGMGRHPPWERHPLVALLPAGFRQWHPMLVHFPIALLVLEAGILCILSIRPNEQRARLAAWLLRGAVLSLAPVVYTGIRDAGVDLDAGAPFWSGLEDRVHNLFRLESSVSLHVLFGLTTGGLAVGRLLWCAWARDAVLRGWQRYLFTAVALLGLWVLFGGAQVGGGISHR